MRTERPSLLTKVNGNPQKNQGYSSYPHGTPKGPRIPFALQPSKNSQNHSMAEAGEHPRGHHVQPSSSSRATQSQLTVTMPRWFLSLSKDGDMK